MPGRLEGKVAFITGAARGQGRSHAVRFAEEGADIIAVDLCDQIQTNPYPLASRSDLDEMVNLVEKTGRRVIARQADVRDRQQLQAAVDDGINELGHLDVVVANAGILPIVTPDPQAFIDAVDVDLIGVMNTVAVSLPRLGEGASIVLIGSTAGLMPNSVGSEALGPGGGGYAYAKQVISTYVERLALYLAPGMIRANAVHPTNCNTQLLHQEALYGVFRPDLEKPTREDAELAFAMFQAMPIPYIEPQDVTNLVLFLASEEARYITGMNMRVDGGALIKYSGGT